MLEHFEKQRRARQAAAEAEDYQAERAEARRQEAQADRDAGDFPDQVPARPSYLGAVWAAAEFLDALNEPDAHELAAMDTIKLIGRTFNKSPDLVAADALIAWYDQRELEPASWRHHTDPRPYCDGGR